MFAILSSSQKSKTLHLELLGNQNSGTTAAIQTRSIVLLLPRSAVDSSRIDALLKKVDVRHHMLSVRRLLKAASCCVCELS